MSVTVAIDIGYKGGICLVQDGQYVCSEPWDVVGLTGDPYQERKKFERIWKPIRKFLLEKDELYCIDNICITDMYLHPGIRNYKAVMSLVRQAQYIEDKIIDLFEFKLTDEEVRAGEHFPVMRMLDIEARRILSLPRKKTEAHATLFMREGMKELKKLQPDEVDAYMIALSIEKEVSQYGN